MNTEAREIVSRYDILGVHEELRLDGSHLFCLYLTQQTTLSDLQHNSEACGHIPYHLCRWTLVSLYVLPDGLPKHCHANFVKTYPITHNFFVPQLFSAYFSVISSYALWISYASILSLSFCQSAILLNRKRTYMTNIPFRVKHTQYKRGSPLKPCINHLDQNQLLILNFHQSDYINKLVL